MVVSKQAFLSFIFLAIFGLAMATHIDDVNGELSNFSYDRVVFRLQKDCSLDKIPDVNRTLNFLDQVLP